MTERGRYIVGFAGWVGFGRSPVEQPDLFQAEYRVGFFEVTVCHACFRGRLKQLHDEIDRITGWAKKAGLNVAEALAAIERRQGEGR